MKEKANVKMSSGLPRQLRRIVPIVVSLLAATGLYVDRSLVAQQTTTRGARTTPGSAPPPRIDRATTIDWPLHNIDIRNTRYAAIAEINPSNVSRLALKWSFRPDRLTSMFSGVPVQLASTDSETPTVISEISPLVVDGVMYISSPSRVFALNAATGDLIWTFSRDPFKGDLRSRGPAYGDGKLYVVSPAVIYALDAQYGRLVESFGDNGQLRIVNAALNFKYPGKYAADVDPATLGYSMSNPPAYWNGTLYVGVPFSDSHIPGGLVVAADATTGAIKWVFNTVPQGPQDEGWDIAKDTWGSGARAGGGVWTTPAIDPELGLIYFNAGNPSPDYDGSARIGMNLFTNSTIALRLSTGKLAWYQQAIHHDVWDRDHVGVPVLFDVPIEKRLVKGIAVAGKTCFVYMWNRETGEPVHPIVETAMPTTTDVPGEQIWPTQPIPYTAKGMQQRPFCPQYPTLADRELAKYARQMFYPRQVNEFVISAGGSGANYGGPSLSPRTGLFYVSGKTGTAGSGTKVKPVGDTIKPGPGNKGHYDNLGEQLSVPSSGGMPKQTLAAYDPATGEQVWYAEMPGTTNAGNFVTAGDVVIQPGGQTLYAFDARSGKQLFSFKAPATIRATPITYQVNGKQYVTVVASHTVVTLSLP
jgi:glucose dehydrogenase